MTVLPFPARPDTQTNLVPAARHALAEVPLATPPAAAPVASRPEAAPRVAVLPGTSTADRVALAALIAATGPAVAGYLVDTGVPAAQLLANALAGTALVVHLVARCTGRLKTGAAPEAG